MIRIDRRPSSASKGFTLIEVLIVSTILAVVLGALFMLIGTTQKTYASASMRQTLEDRARVILSQMADELRRSSSGKAPQPVSTIVPAAPTALDQTITFQMCSGYNTGISSPLYGNLITYSSSPMTGEPDDGVDNDRNGVIDERQITRTEVGVNGGLPVVQCQWLKEGSLKFIPTNVPFDQIEIQFTLERLDPSSTSNIPGTPGYSLISINAGLKVKIRK